MEQPADTTSPRDQIPSLMLGQMDSTGSQASRTEPVSNHEETLDPNPETCHNSLDPLATSSSQKMKQLKHAGLGS